MKTMKTKSSFLRKVCALAFASLMTQFVQAATATGKAISFNICQPVANGQSAAGKLTSGETYATLVGSVPYAGWSEPASALQNGNWSETPTTVDHLVQYDFATGESSATDVSCAMYIANTTNISREPTKGNTYAYLSAFLSMFGGSENTARLTFSNIPYKKYDVYVYFSGCNGTLNPSKKVTNFKALRVNDGSYYVATSTDGTVVASDATERWGDNTVSDRLEEGVNVLVFRDQTSDTLKLENSFSHHGMAAVQIVDRSNADAAKKSMSINFCQSGQDGSVSTLQTTAIGAVPALAWKNTSQNEREANSAVTDADNGGKLIENLLVWDGVSYVQQDSSKEMRFGVQQMHNLWYASNGQETTLTGAYSYLDSALCHKAGANFDANIYVTNTGDDFQYYDVIVYLSAADLSNGHTMPTSFSAIKINDQWYKGDLNAEGTKTVSCEAADTWGETPVTSENGGQLGKTAVRVNGLSGQLHIQKTAQDNCGIAAIQIVEAEAPKVVAIEIPDAPTGAEVEVTVGGEVAEIVDGSIEATTGAEIVVTYSAAEGYIMTPVVTTFAAGDKTTIQVPAAGDITQAVAKIDTTLYPSLAAAVGEAENAQTITIIGDVSSEKVAIENKVIYISGAINGRNVDCECEVPMKNGDTLFGDLEMAVAEVTSKGYSPFVVKSSVLFKMHKGVKIESDIVLPPYANTNSAIYFDATYCGMDEQTLDLNGHTISQTQGGPGGYWWSSVHVNCAMVKIVDTSEEQTGKITGIGSCITITGYDEYQGYSFPAQVTLASGTLTVTGKPQKAGSNTYYAENGIVGIFYSGKFIMTGGKIDAVTDLDPEGKVAGVIADGAVTTYGMPSVTITGGEIVGVPLDHLIQRKPGLPLSTDGLFAGAIVSEDMITISGGTFSTPIKPEYCADDYYPTVINGVYGVCTNPVAQIGDLYFLTYAEAVAVAKAAIASATDKDAIIDAIVANTIVAIKAPTEKIVVDNEVAIFFDFSADTYYVANNATATKRDALYKKYFDVQCAMSFGYNSSVNPRPSVTLVGGGEAILDAMIDTKKRVNNHARANYYHMIYTYKNIKFTKDWETPVYGNIGIVFSTRAGTEASPVVVDLNGHTLLQGKAIGNPSGMRIWQADSGYTKMIDSTANDSNGFIGNGWLIGDQNTIAVQNGATFVLDSGNISHRGSYYKKPLKDSKGVVYDYELDAHIVAAVLGGKFIMNGGRLTWKGMDDSSTGILAELVNVYQANAVINGGTIDVIPSDICNRAEKYYWCDDDGSGEPYPYGPYKAISGVSIYWYAEAGVSYGKDIKFVNQVARVGNTYYEDIDAAFEAAYESEDKEITLLHSVDYDKNGNVAGTYNYDAEIVLAASVEKFTVETTYMYYDAKVTSEVSTKGVIGRPRYETKKDTILKHDFDYDWVDYSTCEQVVVDTEHKDTQEALPAPISVETATLEAKKGLVPGLAEKQISEMTATEKQEILEAKEGNGLKVWENIVLGLNGTKHFDVATESESTRYGEVLDLSVSKSELLNTGFEVAYQVVFSNPDAGIEPTIYAYGSTIYLEQPSINPTGLYEVQAIITSGDPNMKPIVINTQNQIGVIKNADEVTEPKTIAVAVPFTGATVENLLNTKLLNEGDELKAYVDGAYSMWSLDAAGKWVSKQTVRAGGTETAPNAETTALKRGTAVWVTTAGQVVTLGTFDKDAEIAKADETVNLLANPTMEAFEPAITAETVIGDQVIETGVDHVRYTVVEQGGAKTWRCSTTIRKTVDGEVIDSEKIETKAPSIRVGRGYWMMKKSENK